MDKDRSDFLAKTMSTHSDHQDLAELLAKLSAKVESGQVIDWEKIYSRYPNQTQELDEIRPAMEALQNLKFSDDRANQLPTTGLGNDRSRDLGDFRILREIGRGGMGVVYEAEQISIERHVALKILPLAELIDEKSLARFKNEVTAIATLDHPHIVSVHSIGEERGVHYYAMQLIRGQSLAAVIRELQDRTRNNESVTGAAIDQVVSDMQANSNESANLAADVSKKYKPDNLDETVARGGTGTARITDLNYFRNIVRLMLPVADALQHAHEQGVVHRDVKPGNLLLDKNGKLFVTDFGLARIEAGAGVTMTGDMIGTLRYMSPEQVLAGHVLVDYRTDIYSLGATLYELLTLQPLWSGSNKADLIRHVSLEEPIRPRKTNPLIPVDLDTIVLKAISKNPAERYDSAQSMADDLQSYLDSKPILARPPNTAQRVAKWTRRNPTVMWMSLFSLLILTIFFGVSALAISKSRDRAEQQRAEKEIERKEADRQRQVATDQRSVARQEKYFAEIVLGQIQIDRGNPGGLYTDLISYLPLPAEKDVRNWEWYYLMSQCRPEMRTIVNPKLTPFAAWSPDGKYIGAAGLIWKSDTGTCIRRFETSEIRRYRPAWSPDGNKLAWGMASDENAFYVWNRTTDTINRFAAHNSSVWALDWSSDGSQLLSGSLDHTIKNWNVNQQKLEWSIERTTGINSLDQDPQGNQLAVGYQAAQGVEIWDIEQRQLVKGIPTPGLRETKQFFDHAVSWHPNGKTLAVSAGEGWWIYETEDWKLVDSFEMPRCRAIAHSPDGSLVALAHGDMVSVFDSNGESVIAELKGHRFPVRSVSWHPDSRKLVSNDEVREIKLWDLDQLELNHSKIESKLWPIAWSDNETIFGIDWKENSAFIWLNRDGTLKKREKLAVESPLSVSVQANLVAEFREAEHAVSICDASTGANRAIITVDPMRQFRSAHLSRDGSKIVVQSESASIAHVEVWDVDQERLVWNHNRNNEGEAVSYGLPEPKVKAKNGLGDRHLWRIIWNSNGSRFSGVGRGDIGENGSTYWLDHLYIFDVEKQARLVKYLPKGRSGISSTSWDETGNLLALGTADGRVEIVNAENQARILSEKISRDGISAIAWHPDGKRLSVGTREGEVQVISCHNGKALLNFEACSSRVTSLAWSDDGQRLAAASFDDEIQIWDASRAFEMTNADGGRRGELAWAYYDRSLQNSGESRLSCLKEFLRHAPDNLGFWLDRGNAFAELGDFERAAEEFTKAIGPDLRYSFLSVRSRAFALLGSQQIEDYHQSCSDLVEAFQDSPIPSNQLRIAWLASLNSNPLIDYDLVVKMAGAYEPVLGVALYRNGQFEKAIRPLTRFVAKMDFDGDWTNDGEVAIAKYVLSMCRSALDQNFQAKRLLEEANEQANSFINRSPGKDWMRIVTLNALRKEATAKIGD